MTKVQDHEAKQSHHCLEAQHSFKKVEQEDCKHFRLPNHEGFLKGISSNGSSPHSNMSLLKLLHLLSKPSKKLWKVSLKIMITIPNIMPCPRSISIVKMHQSFENLQTRRVNFQQPTPWVDSSGSHALNYPLIFRCERLFPKSIPLFSKRQNPFGLESIIHLMKRPYTKPSLLPGMANFLPIDLMKTIIAVVVGRKKVSHDFF